MTDIKINPVPMEAADVLQFIQDTALLNFWLDNVGRLSVMLDGPVGSPTFRFVLNPPGRRQQFLREDVRKALIDVKERLKAPQYGRE